MNLKPEERRRLICEQAVYRRFDSMKECSDACQDYVDKHGINMTFHRDTIRQYVACYSNLSVKRLKIVSEVLHVPDLKELDEVFIAPKHRGEGLDWIGVSGTRVKDIDIRTTKTIKTIDSNGAYKYVRK